MNDIDQAAAALAAHHERARRAEGVWRIAGSREQAIKDLREEGHDNVELIQPSSQPSLRHAASGAFDQAWEAAIDGGDDLCRRFERLVEESDALRLHGRHTLVVFPNEVTQVAWQAFRDARGELPPPRQVELTPPRDVIPEVEVTEPPTFHEDDIVARVVDA